MSPPLCTALLTLAAAALLICTGLSACGGASAPGASSTRAQSSGASAASAQTVSKASAPDPSEVVAEVGDMPITKTEMNHWMPVVMGQGYYELSGRHTVPAGLVSEPPDYASCVRRLEAAIAVAPRSQGERPAPTGVKLLGKCRQLYAAMRFEAAKYLVRAHLVPALAEELGIRTNNAEVLAAYRRTMHESHPKPAELSNYLAARRTSVADELVTVKLDVLSDKLLQKIKADPTVVTHAEARWTARTRCKPGYVAEYCSEYREGQFAPGALPPSVLLEQTATLVTGRCTNTAACGKE